MFRRRRPPAAIARDRMVEIIARNVALAASFDESSREHLLDTTAALIDAKRWEGIGIELTDEILVTIAANAAIPVLALDVAMYRLVRAVLVRPSANISTGTRAGPVAGVLSDAPMTIDGEATANEGPLSLAWNAVRVGSRHPGRGRNVVIHEFAHKIDMSDGYSDGTPPLRGADRDRWLDVLDDEYDRVDGRPSDDALRPYAWANRAEFFAVSTEAFFCTPAVLRDGKPELYDALRSFYRQDPAHARGTARDGDGGP